jgi:DNA-binding response OmpR family regulator
MSRPARETPKVLIVEDQPEYSAQLERAFATSEGLRFDVKVARSAYEAIPYITKDQIDIYVVDLELPENNAGASEKVGKALIEKIVSKTNGGLIIHSSKLRKDREDFLIGGVDDYIEKGEPISYVVAKAFAVWRRVKNAHRPTELKISKKERFFRIGKWRFKNLDRHLISEAGETTRLSPTELAFIQYLCTIDSEIDRREFNVAVLGRPAYEEDKRIDNLVYRLREKLGETFQIVSRRDSGTYRLLDFQEIRNQK